jgi:predicted DsbA family dithiol-disulfide isomerase
MRIEFWSDVVCPFCGLMDHRLRRALDEFEHGDEVEVVHRSFQLHPDLPREGVTQRELITMAGASPSTVDRVLRPIERSAEAEGFGPYHAVDRKLGPTDLAHEVLAYAADIGRGDEIQQAMFQFHFGKAGNLWTEPDLLVFADEAGLDRDEVRKVLRSRRYKSKVDTDQRAALRYGIQGTPFMLIDGQYAVPGAVDPETLQSAIQTGWAAAQKAA